jgi:Uridine phosphorylase
MKPIKDMESTFQASELTLAPDGSLYHIRLKPYELADNVIIVGDPARVDMVARHFDKITIRKTNREINSCTGEKNGTPITVISTGMGVGAIDIIMTELDACCNIDLQTRQVKQEKRQLNIVRLGTCGSLQDNACGDFLCSKYVIGIDGIMYFYKTNPQVMEEELANNFVSFMQWDRTLPRPYALKASEELLKKIAFDIPQGITVTAPGFYGPQGRNIRLQTAFPNINTMLPDFEYKQTKITNYEMETSAIYAIGRNLGHNCITLCVVIASRKKGDFLNDYSKQMDSLVDTALQRLC